MAYTPNLNARHSRTLRRIAWALDKPMTETIQEIIEHIASIANKKDVCAACRDKTACKDCAINNPEISALKALLPDRKKK